VLPYEEKNVTGSTLIMKSSNFSHKFGFTKVIVSVYIIFFQQVVLYLISERNSSQNQNKQDIILANEWSVEHTETSGHID
jgi:hypothetical protein